MVKYPRACAACGELRLPHARDLCKRCYQKTLRRPEREDDPYRGVKDSILLHEEAHDELTRRIELARACRGVRVVEVLSREP